MNLARKVALETAAEIVKDLDSRYGGEHQGLGSERRLSATLEYAQFLLAEDALSAWVGRKFTDKVDDLWLELEPDKFSCINSDHTEMSLVEVDNIFGPLKRADNE